MKIEPLKDNVLIAPEKEADKLKTDTGIYLPESSEKDERPQLGKVLAVGDSKRIKVKKGQKVIFNKYSGTEINIKGEKMLLVKNAEILAVVKK